jgi:hypothetical protein
MARADERWAPIRTSRSLSSLEDDLDLDLENDVDLENEPAEHGFV